MLLQNQAEIGTDLCMNHLKSEPCLADFFLPSKRNPPDLRLKITSTMRQLHSYHRTVLQLLIIWPVTTGGTARPRGLVLRTRAQEGLKRLLRGVYCGQRGQPRRGGLVPRADR